MTGARIQQCSAPHLCCCRTPLVHWRAPHRPSRERARLSLALSPPPPRMPRRGVPQPLEDARADSAPDGFRAAAPFREPRGVPHASDTAGAADPDVQRVGESDDEDAEMKRLVQWARAWASSLGTCAWDGHLFAQSHFRAILARSRFAGAPWRSLVLQPVWISTEWISNLATMHCCSKLRFRLVLTPAAELRRETRDPLRFVKRNRRRHVRRCWPAWREGTPGRCAALFPPAVLVSACGPAGRRQPESAAAAGPEPPHCVSYEVRRRILVGRGFTRHQDQCKGRAWSFWTPKVRAFS